MVTDDDSPAPSLVPNSVLRRVTRIGHNQWLTVIIFIVMNRKAKETIQVAHRRICFNFAWSALIGGFGQLSMTSQHHVFCDADHRQVIPIFQAALCKVFVISESVFAKSAHLQIPGYDLLQSGYSGCLIARGKALQQLLAIASCLFRRHQSVLAQGKSFQGSIDPGLDNPGHRALCHPQPEPFQIVVSYYLLSLGRTTHNFVDEFRCQTWQLNYPTNVDCVYRFE